MSRRAFAATGLAALVKDPDDEYNESVDARRSWPRLALRNLARGQLPPPPAPFFFTLGRLDLRLA